MCSAIVDRFVVEDDTIADRLNIYPLKNIFRPRPYYLIMQKNAPYLYPQVKVFYAFLMHEFEVDPECQAI